MFSKLFRIFGLSMLALLLVCGVYFGKLYRETTAVFESLRPEIKQADDASQAELFIGGVLFDEAKKFQAKPAELIARTKLRAQPRDKMINYQIKTIILGKRLNTEFSDEQILSYWLSSVYFGAGEYGLEPAAQSLFQKNSDALTEDELVSLAALIRYPQLRNDPLKWAETRNRLKESMIQRNKAP